MSEPLKFLSGVNVQVAPELGEDDYLLAVVKDPVTSNYSVKRVLNTEVGGGSAIKPRQTKTFSTGNGTTLGSIAIAKTILMLYVSMSAPCRLRMYCADSYRTADLDRPASIFPNTNNGLMFEFIAVPGLLAAPLSPGVTAFNADTPNSNVHYWTVEADSAVDITLTYVEIEP